MNRKFIGVLLIVFELSVASGQDTRSVTEPKTPPPCTYLISNKSSLNKDSINDQPVIQNAIDQCPKGHSVHLSASNQNTVFVSGPIVIKSGVSLVIDKEVTLFASTDPKLYDRGSRTCGTNNQTGRGCRAFITSENTSASGILGQGIIDGQGNAPMDGTHESWWSLARRAQREKTEHNIPRLIEIINSTEFTLYQVSLKNSPNFHVALSQVDGFTAWGIKIDSPQNARNTDGIDPISSRNITITKSFIRTGDDSIAIKAGHKGMSENISILDNHFYNGHGMSIGSETLSGVRNVWVERLSLEGGTAGIRIKSDSSRGGRVSHIRYNSICMRQVRNPIELTQFYNPAANGSLIPEFTDIQLHSVYSLTPGKVIAHRLPSAKPIEVNYRDVYLSGERDVSLINAPEPVGVKFQASGDLRGQCDDFFVPFPEDSKPSTRPQLSEAQAKLFTKDEVFKYAGPAGKEKVSPWDTKIFESNQIHYFVDAQTDQEDHKHFKTLQSAVNQLVNDVKVNHLTTRQFISVSPGIYNEVVYVPNLAAPVTIVGTGHSPSDTVIRFNLDASISGAQYARLVGDEFKNSDSSILSMFQETKNRENITTFGSATVWTRNIGFQMSNLTVANSYVRETLPCSTDCQGYSPTVMHQAVALMVDGADQSIFNHVRLLGLQDTLYLKAQAEHVTSRNYFLNSYIEGDVDFIFGDATAFFFQTEIKSLGSRKDSYVGAPSTNVRSRYGFVFDHCTFTHDNSPNAKEGVYRLARQWFHNQKCTPYGPLPLEQYSCQLGPSDNYSEPKGQISSNTLQNVGKMIVMNSLIGSHINSSHPWANWNSLGKISYRPVQYSRADFMGHLKELGFSELLAESSLLDSNSPEAFLAEFNNSVNH